MSYRLRYHPAVRSDLVAIHAMLAEYAGTEVAARKLAEIEAAARGLAELPHRGSRRDHILEGLRAVPAARRAVIAFTVDDAAREVLVLAVTYGGADWIGRASGRG